MITTTTAAALVTRQSRAAKRVAKRAEIEGLLLGLEQEMKTFIYKHRWANYDNIGLMLEVSFWCCNALLEHADYLAWYERRFYKRFCVRMFGRHMTRIASKFPHGPDEHDEIMRQIGYTAIDGEGRVIDIDYVQSTFLMPMISGRDWLYRPNVTDVVVARDARGRGLLNVYRMVGLVEAGVWGDRDQIRNSVAWQILRACLMWQFWQVS